MVVEISFYSSWYPPCIVKKKYLKNNLGPGSVVPEPKQLKTAPTPQISAPPAPSPVPAQQHWKCVN